MSLQTLRNLTIPAEGPRPALPAIFTPGDTTLPAVLMCHGIEGNKNEYQNTFAHLAARLEERGQASLRFDFRGHGDSEARLADYCLATEIADTLAAARWLLQNGFSRITLLGFSFGGPPALAVATLLESVERLVLVAPVVDFRATFLEPCVAWGRETFGIRRVRAGILAGGIRLAENYTLSPALLTELLLADIPGLAGRLAKEWENTRKISIFHGDSDRLVPLAAAEALCRHNPHIRLRIMQNTGHGVTDFAEDRMDTAIARRNLDEVARVLAGEDD